MITPLELEKLEIDKSFGGYKKSSVDDILALIKSNYETLYKENIAQKDRIAVLEELVSKYKAMEDTMKNSIILAQQTGEEAISASREQADILIKNARSQVKAIEEESKAEQRKLFDVTENMKKDLTVFAAKNISLLQAQIEILEQIKQEAAKK
ncbi:MAG: DivIVA domain-containing protein [Clostridia bacterium]|nr:DivIVA domain-containing protein [Clostridia bacterium]